MLVASGVQLLLQAADGFVAALGRQAAAAGGMAAEILLGVLVPGGGLNRGVGRGHVRAVGAVAGRGGRLAHASGSVDLGGGRAVVCSNSAIIFHLHAHI